MSDDYDPTMSTALRFLSVDAVERAQSGHPGMPLGMADVATVLWEKHLRVDPAHPNWVNRDRWILSNGHGSALQYAALHLAGFPFSIDDLKSFRSLGSVTPGHPELDVDRGVECTSGPLGQGLSCAVGIALAEKIMASRFNQSDFPLIDYNTYVFVGDGCLMEGISHEASSLSGTLTLSKLIVFWDNNGISIDGDVSGWFTENVPQRFQAYQWHVLEVDGHDPKAIDQAIEQAKADPRPSLIACRTVIGYGAPTKAGRASSHGAPLGTEEMKGLRAHWSWDYPPFEVPQSIYQAWNHEKKGRQLYQNWQDLWSRYQQEYPVLAEKWQERESIDHSVLDQLVADWVVPEKNQATRVSSKKVIEKLIQFSALIGGSADLSGSNGTLVAQAEVISRSNYEGNYLHFGVREFAMAAVANGLALCGFRPFVGTFLTFSDYSRNAIRLACLMKLPVIHVLTHDSIGLGEDGPTHQPIEHLTSLRAMPNLEVWRPADSIETVVAWRAALKRVDGPTALCLSRQALPQFSAKSDDVVRGGYVFHRETNRLQLVLMSTGSELHWVHQAALQMEQQGFGIRVVSMPCHEVFSQQSAAYRQTVLPEGSPRIAVEAAEPMAWHRWLGSQGAVMGLNDYGHSAPGEEVYRAMGLTIELLMSMMRELIQKQDEEES